MLEGTLSVYAFILIFPLAVVAGLVFLIRNYIRTTEWCEIDTKLDGKTIIVTGGSSGLGKNLSVELAKRGARVIVACRTKARRDSTAFFLRSKTGSFNVRVMFMDLTSLDSVWECAREIAESEEKVDMIVNNAAVLSPRDHTSDGIDLMMGVNYVGHFLLTTLLIEKLKQASKDPPRIVNIICGSFRGGQVSDLDDLEGKTFGAWYNMRQTYRNSKLALHLFTKELAKRLRPDNIVAVSVDPGLINSGLYKLLQGPLGKFNQTCAKVLYRTPEEAMQSVLHCILSKEIENESGKLFRDTRIIDIRHPDWNEESMKNLWNKTEELLTSKGINLTLKEDDEEEAEE